jgi:hypothetical protein
MVLDEIGRGTLAVDAIGRLPNSLAGLYYNRAEARFPDGQGYAEARIVLSVLLAARQPLTRVQLAMITGFDADDALLRLLRALNCFVTWDPDIGESGVYRITHKSISDWLVAPARGFDRFKADVAAGRERIIAHCSGWATHNEPYALRYLIAHLLEAGKRAEALAVVRDGFLARRRRSIESRQDVEDLRMLTLALVEAKDAAAILELARTDNTAQRDGVAAGLQSAPQAAGEFVDGIVKSLLQVK